MWSRLRICSCSKLNRLLSGTILTKRFVSLAYVLPQNVTFARSMSLSNKTTQSSPNRSEPPHGTVEESENPDNSSKKLSGRQRLSLVFAEYGVTAVVFHTVISLTSLGLCYAAVSSGLDVPGFLIKIGVSESASQSMAAKGASTFVIAYACHKVFMPLRIFMTVTCTPIIVHRLRSLGLIR